MDLDEMLAKDFDVKKLRKMRKQAIEAYDELIRATKPKRRSYVALGLSAAIFFTGGYLASRLVIHEHKEVIQYINENGSKTQITEHEISIEHDTPSASLDQPLLIQENAQAAVIAEPNPAIQVQDLTEKELHSIILKESPEKKEPENVDVMHDRQRSYDKTPAQPEVYMSGRTFSNLAPKQDDRPMAVETPPMDTINLDIPNKAEYYYFPVRGDTLSRIADMICGDMSKWRDIQDHNQLPTDLIEVNQPLKIPAWLVGNSSGLYHGALDFRIYRAQKYDTLADIASMSLGSSGQVHEILQLNRKLNPRFSETIYNREYVFLPR